MKDNKYTPGPWFAVEYAGYFNIQSQDGYGEKYNLLDREEDENAEANAKLIAASPDLLEACIEALKEMEFHNWHNSKTGNLIRSAINKATV
jgi:hypothetical protein